MRNYDETQCVRDLNKKHDCRISGRLIEVSKDNGDVGKKSWGKIDFLCKNCGYRYMITNFTDSSAPKKNRKKYNEDYEDQTPKTKKGKLNLRNMVKDIMSM